MGKVLVLYHSATGNTERMAHYVADGARAVEGMEVRLRDVQSATAQDILWCDGLAVGAPTNMGTISWQMKRFWDETAADAWGKSDGKIACAFSSNGGWGGGAELTCMALLIVLMNYGFLTFGVTDYVAKQFTLHYGAVLAGEPRAEREVAACQKLGERLAQWVAALVDGRADQHPLVARGETPTS